jgi:abhydrolase domain-containing protein 6
MSDCTPSRSSGEWLRDEWFGRVPEGSEASFPPASPGSGGSPVVGPLLDWMERLQARGYARRQSLILLNGLCEQPESWFRNVGFWRRHFDVFMPNLLCYDGDVLHSCIDAGKPITVDYLVDQLHLYLESFVQSPPYHFVAASLGGKIATEYAARYPQRVGRLVLLCPSGVGDTEQLPIVDGVRRSDLRSIIDSAFFDARRVDPNLQAYYKRQFTDRRWRSGLLRTIRGTMGHSVRDRLREVKAPTLIVSGREDKIVCAREAAIAAKLLPQGHYLCLPRCGHAPQMEKPGFVNRLVIHFLSSSRPSTRLPLTPMSLARPNTIL